MSIGGRPSPGVAPPRKKSCSPPTADATADRPGGSASAASATSRSATTIATRRSPVPRRARARRSTSATCASVGSAGGTAWRASTQADVVGRARHVALDVSLTSANRWASSGVRRSSARARDSSEAAVPGAQPSASATPSSVRSCT